MLFVLFSAGLLFGAIPADLFQQVSLADFNLAISEIQEVVKAEAENRDRETDQEILKRAFKPLDGEVRTVRVGKRDTGSGEPIQELTISSGGIFKPFLFFLIILWLWPLYRHYYSKTPQDMPRIENRILNLPVFLFALVWITALARYFKNSGAYLDLYGVPDLRIKTIFASSSLLFGAFAGYLILEMAQLYIRRFIARPIFAETNPYGLKSGFRVGLRARHALMIFSLAMVPLALCVYIQGIFNWELWTPLQDATDSTFFFEHYRAILPIIITGCIAAIMIFFQVLSILLFDWNIRFPIAALVGRMRSVAAGDFECKSSVLDSDEIGELKGHFNLMLDGLQEREKIKDIFGKYVSIEIAAKILKDGKVDLAGEEIEATILFSDIRDFTPLCEKLSPSELIRFLNAYFSAVTKPIMAEGGVINKFMGDAVMAIFTPVFGAKDHADAALRAATGMREALARFNSLEGYPSVAFGVGLHTGTLIAGNVGSEDRLEYTVLGDTVNVAARIESQTKTQKAVILISDALKSKVKPGSLDGLAISSCGPVLMKGKTKPMELFKVD